SPGPASAAIALQASNVPARLASNRPAPAISANLRTNSIPPPAAPRTLAQTNQPNTNPFVIASAKAAPTEIPKPPPPALPARSEIEVIQVPEELVVKPPQEISVVRPPVLPGSGTDKPIVDAGSQTPLLLNKTEPKPDKRTLF